MLFVPGVRFFCAVVDVGETRRDWACPCPHVGGTCIPNEPRHPPYMRLGQGQAQSLRLKALFAFAHDFLCCRLIKAGWAACALIWERAERALCRWFSCFLVITYFLVLLWAKRVDRTRSRNGRS